MTYLPSDWTHAPTGTYAARIDSLLDGSYSDGVRCLSICLTVERGPHAGKLAAWHTFRLDAAGIRLASQAADASGLALDDPTVLTDLLGKLVSVTITSEVVQFALGWERVNYVNSFARL